MSEQVTAFRAYDGALFENQAECERYEYEKTWRARLEPYFADPETPYRDPVHRSMTTRAIIAWERYKARETAQPVNDLLDLPNRVVNVLLAENITTIDELCQRSMVDLMKLPNFGRHSLRDTRITLAKRGRFLLHDSIELIEGQYAVKL